MSKEMDYKPLFKCVHGSHLYGLNTENSDMDYKGVFMPDIDELLLGKSPKQFSKSSGNDKSKNTSEDTDEDWYSLPEFIKLACQGETIALDMLHVPYWDGKGEYAKLMLSYSPEWHFILQNRHRFYTKNMKAFLGYARKQASKYGIKGSRMGALEEVFKVVEEGEHSWHCFGQLSVPKNVKLNSIWDKLPLNQYCKFVKDKLKSGEEQDFYEVLGSKYQDTMPLGQFFASIRTKWESYGERARQAKENEGIDWKAISHAIRAAYQLKEIYTEGRITYPLKERELLLDIKLGKKDFLTEVQPLLESLIEEVEILAENSSYPEKVDVKFWDDWLLKVYKKEMDNNAC